MDWQDVAERVVKAAIQDAVWPRQPALVVPGRVQLHGFMG